MGRFKWIYIFLSVASLLYQAAAQTWHPHYYHDDMGKEDRDKLIIICEEFMYDIRLQQRQIVYIREQHNFRLAYDVGLVIGRLRERYKRIMDIYREMMDRRSGRIQFFGPGFWSNKPMHYVIAMETIRKLEHEIDQLVAVLEAIPEDAFEPESQMKKFRKKKKTTSPTNNNAGAMPPGFEHKEHPGGPPPPPRPVHSGPVGDRGGGPRYRASLNKTESIPNNSENLTTEPMATLTFRNQDELKSYYREQFENKNKNDKHWSLDHYYGLA